MTWDLFLRVAPFAVSVGAMVVSVIASRRKDVDQRFERVDKHVEERFERSNKRTEEMSRRLQAVEQDVAAMPGKDDLHKLELILTQMGGDMKAMRAEMAGTTSSIGRIENIVSRHEDHLRENH